MVNFDVKNQIIEMTSPKLYPIIDNVYRETMRALLHVFGNIYYIDGNHNKIRVDCVNGDQERAIGKALKDNTLVLPYITVTQQLTSNADERRKYYPVLISEKGWDHKKRRATRVLSLAPRPVDITYQVNVWTKYSIDMDMIRSTIFNMFNPDLNLRTRFSDFNKCFLEDEEDLGSTQAGDSNDRTLKKSITIVVETYIPSPKFMFTNTGEITEFNQEYELFDLQDVMTSSTPNATESVSDNLTKIPTD